MVLPINSLHQIAAVALRRDAAGNVVSLDLTAYVLNAGSGDAAGPAQVLSEPVIPDGSGAFSKATFVEAAAVQITLVYPRIAVGDSKFDSCGKDGFWARVGKKSSDFHLTVHALRASIFPIIIIIRTKEQTVWLTSPNTVATYF